MHGTDTLDYFVLVEGELFMLTETDELRLTPGDAVVCRGVKHGWSNRSGAPALLFGVSIDAEPVGDRSDHATQH